jgi:hypothetical protein
MHTVIQTYPTRSALKTARLVALGALLFFAGAQIAQGAANFACVSTAAELQQALTDASNGGAHVNDDNIIELVAGTYKTGAATGNAPFFFHTTNSTAALSILGGFAPGCGGGEQAASATILDGRGMTGVMSLRSAHGSIGVTHVTIQNGESADPGAGLQINYLVTVNAHAQVDHTIIRHNHSTGDAGGMYISGTGPNGQTTVFVSDVLIVDNSADGNYGAVYMTAFGSSSGFDNSTIWGNTAAASTNRVGGLYCGGTATCSVFNTIAYNNSNFGMYFEIPGAVVCDDYGAIGGAVPIVDRGNVSAPPMFVDSANNDFHLSSASPLFGLCSAGSGFPDLDDHPFPDNGKEDVGAYNDTLFTDGLE